MARSVSRPHRRRNAHKVGRKRKGPPRTKRVIPAPELQDEWDIRAPVRRNLERLGLALPDINEPKHVEETIGPAAAEIAKIGEKIIEATDGKIFVDRNELRPAFLMKKEEVAYLTALVERHGEDYRAMERDLQLNFWQHSAAKLETRIERMRNFLSSQGLPVPHGPAAGGGGARRPVEDRAGTSEVVLIVGKKPKKSKAADDDEVDAEAKKTDAVAEAKKAAKKVVAVAEVKMAAAAVETKKAEAKKAVAAAEVKKTEVKKADAKKADAKKADAKKATKSA